MCPPYRYIRTCIIINPCYAHAARVTVVVLCVCMYVCTYVCVYVHMCIHSYLPPYTLESQNRDTNEFISIQGSFLILQIFLKMIHSKVMVCLPRAASVCFYASVKPIATFSQHRQWDCVRQRAFRWYRLVKRHRYMDHKY